MKRLAMFCGLVLLLVVPALAAEDFTGKWTGSFNPTRPDGTVEDDTIYMELKHKGTELTGTAGPRADEQWPLAKGTVDGNKLTFEVQSPGPLIKFTLTFADGHLKGEAAAEMGSEKMSAKVDAQRAKATDRIVLTPAR